MKNLYIIVGRSGSGKSSIVQELCDSCGLKQVKTTTTRPRRFPEEDSYHFVSQEEFDVRKDIIAPTKICGYSYGVTPEALDAGDIIILDLKGVMDMQRSYTRKPIKVIGIHAPLAELEARMISRGDSREDINRRLENDETKFGMMEDFCDIIVRNMDRAVTAKAVWAFVQMCEAEQERLQTLVLQPKIRENSW